MAKVRALNIDDYEIKEYIKRTERTALWMQDNKKAFEKLLDRIERAKESEPPKSCLNCQFIQQCEIDNKKYYFCGALIKAELDNLYIETQVIPSFCPLI